MDMSAFAKCEVSGAGAHSLADFYPDQQRAQDDRQSDT